MPDLKTKSEEFAEHYAGLVSHGVVATGVNAARNFFTRKNIQAARYSAILDSRVCDYCRFLDGKTLDLDHPAYRSGKYDPPQHSRCRCVWVYIGKNAPPPKMNWEDPPPDLKERLGHWHEELPGYMKKELAELDKIVMNMAKEPLRPMPEPPSTPPSSESLEDLVREQVRKLDKAEASVLLKKGMRIPDAMDHQARIVSRMTKLDLEYVQEKIEMYSEHWAGSSIRSGESLAMQVTMNRMNGLDDWAGLEESVADHFRRHYGKDLSLDQWKKEFLSGHDFTFLGSWLSTSIEYNRQLYAYAKYSPVAYRGVRDASYRLRAAFDRGDSVGVAVRPLSSWTQEKIVARGFGSVVLRMKVLPGEVVLDSRTNHYLLSGEHEMVISSKKNEFLLSNNPKKMRGDKWEVDVKSTPKTTSTLKVTPTGVAIQELKKRFDASKTMTISDAISEMQKALTKTGLGKSRIKSVDLNTGAGGGYAPSNEKIRMSSKHTDGLRKFLSGERTSETLKGLHVTVHEVHHSFSNALHDNTLGKPFSFIEEGLVEKKARDVTSLLFGSGIDALRKKVFTVYQENVAALNWYEKRYGEKRIKALWEAPTKQGRLDVVGEDLGRSLRDVVNAAGLTKKELQDWDLIIKRSAWMGLSKKWYSRMELLEKGISSGKLKGGRMQSEVRSFVSEFTAYSEKQWRIFNLGGSAL